MGLYTPWLFGVYLAPGARVRPSTNHWVSYQPTIGYLTNQQLGILPTDGLVYLDAWRWCGLKHTTNLLIRHGSYEDDAKIVGAPSESIGCKHPNRDGGLVFHFFWADIFYDTTVLDMTHKYPRSLGKRTYICLTALNYVHNFIIDWRRFFSLPPQLFEGRAYENYAKQVDHTCILA